MDASSPASPIDSRLTRRLALQRLASLAVATAVVNRDARGQSADPTVETSHGRLRGLSRDGVNVFKGIPYAGSTEGRTDFCRRSAHGGASVHLRHR
jgi:para-nitrobenzyl esterase